MIVIVESREIPLSTSLTRLSSQAPNTAAPTSAHGTRILRLTETWVIPISLDEIWPTRRRVVNERLLLDDQADAAEGAVNSWPTSAGVSSKTSPNEPMTDRSTSAIVVSSPASRTTDVIVTAGMPHGTMRSKYPRS